MRQNDLILMQNIPMPQRLPVKTKSWTKKFLLTALMISPMTNFIKMQINLENHLAKLLYQHSVKAGLEVVSKRRSKVLLKRAGKFQKVF